MTEHPQAPQPELSTEVAQFVLRWGVHPRGRLAAETAALVRSEVARATREKDEEIARLNDLNIAMGQAARVACCARAAWGDGTHDPTCPYSERDALRAELEHWQRGHVPCSICRGFDCKGHPCE